MEAGDCCSYAVAVPSVGIKFIVKIILIRTAVPLIGPASCDSHGLRTRRSIEVGSLAGAIDFEFLHAVRWGRHHTCGNTASTCTSAEAAASRDSTGRIATKAGRIDLHAAVHVVGIVSTIEHKSALIHDRAGDAAIGAYARLQGHKGADVSADRGESVQ